MTITGWKAIMQWRGNVLYAGRRKVAEIAQDSRYPSMWRVHLPDGELSDMVNKTRAKDAAMAIADRALRLNA